ncbi:hypothetical protein PR002_g13573 [Phytophthora rubi]|uniref:Integrase catalytic domain-containing protein n=1 Tax=Phytophthora rubi TaxID=129364 RepID=A0A6A3LFU0_9STRA|nr:hypothetical protein PR002_g13573 [Phytophthora rubi]
MAGPTETATEVVTPTAAVTAVADEGTAQTASAVDKVQSDAGSRVLTAAVVESDEAQSNEYSDSELATAVTATAVTAADAVKTRTGGTRRRAKSTEAVVTATRPLTRAAKRRSDEQRCRSEGRASAADTADDTAVDAVSVLAAAPDVTALDSVVVKAPDANLATEVATLRTNGAMASTAGKATRKRKRVTFVEMPDDGVAHEAESAAAMNIGVATNAASGDRHDAGHEAGPLPTANGVVAANGPMAGDDQRARSTREEMTTRGTEVAPRTSKARRQTNPRSSTSTTRVGDSARESRTPEAAETTTPKTSTVVSAAGKRPARARRHAEDDEQGGGGVRPETVKAGGGEKKGGGARRKAAKQPRVGNATAGQPVGDQGEAAQRPAGGPTIQLTDAEIMDAQAKSRLVQRLLEVGENQGQEVTRQFGLVTIKTPTGQRVVLPPALWPTAMKECHDSVWAGHLRAPHTYARIAQTYWWPSLRREVKRWVLGCQECGSRKVRPREVILPLRSLRGGDVGDRWALNVAGPLPTTDGGESYVIAAVEYVTRYAVVIAVKQHTADNVTAFLMKNVVLKFGAFRELLTDGAPELTANVIEQLVILLQAQQTSPVPYRQQMIGLVERFHRTWKDCIATYMSDERQRDWDVWVDFAIYAYNSGQHSTVLLSPNELMMGRRLRNPNDLLRSANVTEAGALTNYHRRLIAAMKSSSACAEAARRREQERQKRYYDRKWLGPVRVLEPAGYDNYLVEREYVAGDHEQFIAHASFLVSYHSPLHYWRRRRRTSRRSSSMKARSNSRVMSRKTERLWEQRRLACRLQQQHERQNAVDEQWRVRRQGDERVELRRRRRRDAAGQYVLELEVQDVRPAGARREMEGAKRWISIRQYDQLLQDGRVVEDPRFGEVV